MEFGKSCCFTGHRPAKLPWGYNENDPMCVGFKEKLSSVVEAVCESGVTHFICGMALGCDMYCAEAVIALRKRRVGRTLEAAVHLVSNRYTPTCMMDRNRYMVDKSSILIACYDGKSGGTWNTIKYAMDRDLEIIRLPIT